jgi:hypothetical protein
LILSILLQLAAKHHILRHISTSYRAECRVFSRRDAKFYEINFFFQMEIELHPVKNEVRIRQKQASTEHALLATLQTVPRLGETKARALLDRFPSMFAFLVCEVVSEFLNF